jgi:PAS domain S-box-containing protein
MTEDASATIPDRALAAAGDAVVVVDRTGTILAWNATAAFLFGHPAAEAIGQTLALIIPPEHRARHMAAFHAAIDSGRLANGGAPARVEAITADGTKLALVMSLGLLEGAGGQPAGAVAVLRLAVDPISFI